MTALFRPGVRARLLNRIARQVGSITVIGAYLAPGMTGADMERFLERVQSS